MKLRVVAVMACVLALCLMLAGCGGGADKGPDKSQLVGEWKLVSAEGGDANFDADSLALAESLGLQVRLSLNEDGTGTYTRLADEFGLSWSNSSETEATASIDSLGDVAISLSGDVLTVEGGPDGTMSFTRP